MVSASIDDTTGELVVAVIDSGPGLRGQTMAQLTRDFGGAGGGADGGGNATFSSARSSGMGVPICARLAALMGGSLLVQDRGNVNDACDAARSSVHGTAFILRLPLHRSTSLSAAAGGGGGGAPADFSAGTLREVPSPPLQVSLAGVRVLVVDDSPANRRLAAFLLRQLGCAAPGDADDGDGVLPTLRAAAAAGTPYHVVLMDIMMARMNGDAALAALRAAGEQVPVVVSTGNATAQDVARYVSLGFADVLPKPFRREALEASLARVLGGGAGAPV